MGAKTAPLGKLFAYQELNIKMAPFLPPLFSQGMSKQTNGQTNATKRIISLLCGHLNFLL